MSKMGTAYQELPFSKIYKETDVVQTGNNLLKHFDLTGRTKVIHAPVERSIEIERYFRLNWWISRNDALRYAMHNLGKSLDIIAVNNTAIRETLSVAWEKANLLTNTPEWREFVKQKCSSVANKTYYQLFFRLAQQCVSRAIRWEAVFEEILTPYWFFWELITNGVLPLGMCDNVFYVLRVSEDSNHCNNVQFNFSDIRISYRKSNTNRIFIAYEFNNSVVMEIIYKLKLDKYNLDFGPVTDTNIPIEHQLFDRISQCSLMIVLINQPDLDFGLPIWIYQEMDVAKAVNIPVITIYKDELFVSRQNDFVQIDQSVNLINLIRAEMENI